MDGSGRLRHDARMTLPATPIPGVPAEVPTGDDAIAAAAARAGLPIPVDCREGVVANLALLARHVAMLRAGQS